MNSPLRRLSVVVLAMFLVLMVASTLTQYGPQADALNTDSRNVRTIYREYGRPRGDIVVAGQPIATSVPVDDSFKFLRTYANGPLYAPVTGFFSIVYQSQGLEKTENDVLNGSDDSLLLARLRTLVTGGQNTGGTVELTIDPKVQQAAWDALGDQRGAVVALDPKTGAILAMVSKPSYDPNLLAAHSSKDVQAAWTALTEDEGKPLVNRAIGGDQYAPGSTFKLIDASMLLQTGQYGPDTMLPAPTQLALPGSTRTIQNPGGAACGEGEQATLAYALQVSCNTPFAAKAMELGRTALEDQANAYGFGKDLSVPLKVTPSRFGDPQDDATLAMTSIGQYSVRVTPMQMAMVAAAIANKGVEMTPYLVQTTRGPDLQVVSTADPQEFGRPISAASAQQLRDMMVNVVANGTGKPARISGVDVAAKTGTAQAGDDGAPHAWFTAFAPADDPQVAVAVVVERGGNLGDEATGGRVAGPVAKAVIEAVLNK